MRIAKILPARARTPILVAAVVTVGLLSISELGGGERPEEPVTQPDAGALTPYAADPEHPWNRLHRALFVREVDRSVHVHFTDPLLYMGGSHLLDEDSHRTAVAMLDQFLANSDDRLIDASLKRFFFQHDLWAAFDYAAWYPDDWVFKSQYEPAAIALRNRLARAIGRLALADGELAALPDNYALAVKSKEYATDYDPALPKRPFVPPDLFDDKGPWVRFHETTAQPIAERHFAGAGGRAAHVIFLRLPGGRAATEQYLKGLHREEPYQNRAGHYSAKQFPAGTMVAMVRRALTVDQSAKVRVTPVTELLQIRVYRRIPEDPEANFQGDFGEQDVYEFVLHRQTLFAGQHGLLAISAEDKAKPSFERNGASDPFEMNRKLPTPQPPAMPELKTCIQCHQAPGVYSVLSMERGLRGADAEPFRTYDWDVEMSLTVGAKVKQFDWGLLQGKLELK